MSSHIASTRVFAQNLLSGWLAMVVDVVIAFSLTPFIVAQLGIAAYGLWSLAVNVIGYLGLIDLGMRGSVGRYINHYLARKDYKALNEVIGTAVTVLLVLGFIALLTSSVVAAQFTAIFPKTPLDFAQDINFILPMMAAGLLLAFLNAILTNLLMAREKLYLSNGMGILISLIRAAATVVVLRNDGGLVGLAGVTVSAAMLQFIILFGLVHGVYRDIVIRWFNFSLERLLEIARFGSAVFAARTISTMTVDAAPFIGMWTLGPEAVGVYSLALTLVQNGKRLIDQAGTAIYPSVVKSAALRDYANLRNLYLRYMRVTLPIGGLVFTGMAVFATDFLRLWVGEGFAYGGNAVAILALGYLMVQFGSTGAVSLQSLDRVDLTLKIGVAEATTAVGFMLLLSGPMGLGIMGLALGTALPLTVSATLIYPALSNRIIGEGLITALLREVIRALLVLSATGLVFLGVHRYFAATDWIRFFTAVGICTLLYLPAGAWLAGILPSSGDRSVDSHTG